jgi:hypothetical protein
MIEPCVYPLGIAGKHTLFLPPGFWIEKQEAYRGLTRMVTLRPKPGDAIQGTCGRQRQNAEGTKHLAVPGQWQK